MVHVALADVYEETLCLLSVCLQTPNQWRHFSSHIKLLSRAERVQAWYQKPGFESQFCCSLAMGSWVGVCLYNFLKTQFSINRMKELLSTLQNKYEEYMMRKKKAPKSKRNKKDRRGRGNIVHLSRLHKVPWKIPAHGKMRNPRCFWSHFFLFVLSDIRIWILGSLILL